MLTTESIVHMHKFIIKLFTSKNISGMYDDEYTYDTHYIPCINLLLILPIDKIWMSSTESIVCMHKFVIKLSASKNVSDKCDNKHIYDT